MFDSKSFLEGLRNKRIAEKGIKNGSVPVRPPPKKATNRKPKLPQYPRLEMVAREYNNAHYLEKNFYDDVVAYRDPKVTNQLETSQDIHETSSNRSSVMGPYRETSSKKSGNSLLIPQFGSGKSFRNRLKEGPYQDLQISSYNTTKAIGSVFDNIDFFEMVREATLKSMNGFGGYIYEEQYRRADKTPSILKSRVIEQADNVEASSIKKDQLSPIRLLIPEKRKKPAKKADQTLVTSPLHSDRLNLPISSKDSSPKSKRTLFFKKENRTKSKK